MATLLRRKLRSTPKTGTPLARDPREPWLLRSVQDIRDFVTYALKKCPAWIAMDTETVGISEPGVPTLKKNALVLDRARAFLITFYAPAIGPVGVFTHYSGAQGALPSAAVMRELRPLLTQRRIVCHHANYDLNVLENGGIAIPDFDCTMVMSHCLDAERPKSLKQLALLVGMVLRETRRIDLSDQQDALLYGCDDVVATGRLYQAFSHGKYYDHITQEFVSCPELKMDRDRHLKHYTDVEKPTISIFVKAERRGIQIDRELFADMESRMEKKIQELEYQAYELAGRPFNLGSVPQLRQILYEEMGLPKTRMTKTGPSTDEMALMSLQHLTPFAKVLIDIRGVTKLLSSYVRGSTGIPALADRYGVVHASINTVGAKTDRMSVTLPALQTIPKNAEWPIRQGFIARKGCKLIAADYDRMEMVLMANFCKDPVMVQAIRDGQDIHQITADTVGCTRTMAKTLNFALIYGCSARRLMEQLSMSGINISLDEAEHLRARFFGLYTRILPFRAMLFDWHRKNGFVTYLNGRNRVVPDMNSSNKKLRAQAERTLGNNIIQGCQPFSSLITTKDGAKRLDKIQVGDMVYTGKRWSPVCNVFDVGEKPLFKVKFSDGSTRECSDEHLWGIESGEWVRTSDLQANDRVLAYVDCQPDVLSVVSVEDTGLKVPMMDLTVDDDEHAYTLSNGALCHNSGAGWCKEATIRLAQRDDFNRLGGTILLQIHDELLMEAPEENADEISRIAVEEMAKPPAICTFEIVAPLSASAKTGTNWGELK